MMDPAGTGGMVPVPPQQGTLGAPVGNQEPDAALRSTAVDTANTRLDTNLVKPKGGQI